jgi:Toxin PAAR-like domain
VPSTILVNGLGLTYKSTIGISMATLPDVCKTPSPGGPIPIPYPNIADQSTLDNGTTTVFAHGQMIAIKGSEYSMSSGDEAGTVGGVTSNTFKKETAWISYSFDVKFDGGNACRHTDKKFHNHKNTVDLAGNLDPAMGPPNLEKELQKIAQECEDEVEGKEDKPKECKDRGTMKHECCDRKISDATKDDNPRRVYSDCAFNKSDGSMVPRDNPVRGGMPPEVPRTRTAIMNQARGYAARFGGDTSAAIGSFVSGKKFPDVVISTNGNEPPGRGNTAAVYDFKFPCPKDKKPQWGDNGKQGETYNEMLEPRKAPRMITPTFIMR